MIKSNINIHEEIEDIVTWIKQYFIDNGPDCNAIIGISGGKDSTVSAALLVKALGADRVIGVLMPDGEQADIVDAREVCTHLGIRSIEINIGETCDALYGAIGYDKCLNNARIMTNTPARIRMATLYAVAAMYHGRVCSNSNASEIYVGYSTKFGDGAGDFALLREYTAHEVVVIGEALKLPNHLIYKAPADGMSGKTDEEAMGFSYSNIDGMLLEGKVPDYETYRKITEAHRRNEHKNRSIPHPYRSRCLHTFDNHWRENF